MKMSISRLLFPAAAAALVLSVACGGGDKKDSGVAGTGPFPQIDQRSSSDEVAKAVDQAVKDAVKDPEQAQKTAQQVAQKNMSGPGRCEVKVSGDENVSFSSGGGAAAVGPDYWYSEDELRTSLRMLAKVGGAKTDADADREVKEAMAKDPRLMLLVLNCGKAGDKAGGSLSLLPSNESTYADVPFGPKTYPIAKGGVLGGGAKAGEFSVIFSLKDVIYALDEPGELKITKFDKSGIAGSFSFKASERFAEGSAKKVTVQGT